MIAVVCGLFFAAFVAIDSWATQYKLPAAPMVLAEPQPTIEAAAAVVIDQATGKMVFSKQENVPMYPASLTKLMTTLLVAEKADWSHEVVIGKEVSFIGADASIAGLCEGDRLTVEELVWATLLPSGNDAAYVLAAHVGRLSGGQHLTPQAAVTEFIKLMNERAEELGTHATQFMNPDGYHHAYQMATAYDLALIAQTAYEHPKLAPIFRAAEHCTQIQRAGATVGKTWHNTNLLLDETSPYYYKWADGLKTGTTPEAGHCLAATASKGNQHFLVIVLRSTEEGRYIDATSLLEYAFNGGVW